MRICRNGRPRIRTHGILICCVVLAITQLAHWKNVAPKHLQQLEAGIIVRNETLVKNAQNDSADFSFKEESDALHQMVAVESLVAKRVAMDFAPNSSKKSPILQEDMNIQTSRSGTSVLASPPNTRHFPPPKVVILAGPHKAGSTSLQRCMVDWTHNPDRIKDAWDRWEYDRERWTRINNRRKKRGKPFEDHMPPHLTADPKLLPPVLPNWSWPAPLSTLLNKTGARHTAPEKSFASLMVVADYDVDFVMRNFDEEKPSIPPQMQQDHILTTFQTAMVDAWESGYKLVYGNEEFDRISHPRVRSSTQVLDTILEILPWNTTIAKVSSEQNTSTAVNITRQPSLARQDIEAVIVYRSPRIEHLKSLWKELGKYDGEQTFREFLSCRAPGSRPCLREHSNVIDPLLLASRLIDRGVRTTVVEMVGVEALANQHETPNGEKTNLCHAVACNILRDGQCTNYTKVETIVERVANITTEDTQGFVDVSTQRFNQREDIRPVDLTKGQWNEIETALQQYDCGWRRPLVDSPLFRILYHHILFVACDNSEVKDRSFSWLIDTIERIAS